MSLPNDFDNIPRICVAQLPTPVHGLPRLSKSLLGPRILVKRDDQTGLATGGNKARKLEYLVADAIAKGSDTLLTAGAPQSNHCRQTAAVAALKGLNCDLILGGEEPEIWNGNLLLDRLLGARAHFTEKEKRSVKMDEIAADLKKQGRRPYVIPIGGSNGVGALGYVRAMVELQGQLKQLGEKVDRIVFGSSSGGTQAGMALGARIAGFSGQVLGISVDQEKLDDLPYQRELAEISNESAKLIGSEEQFGPTDYELSYDYLGGGYGVVGDMEREAIQLCAGTEGLLLDPVYTGRAFGGMIDLIRKSYISSDETVLFWHTGGTSALFGYAGEI
ncbi:MAG: L-cysteate sulfo-lyase [Candidatus Moanabacter tarae]|uniref:L-cysteate sulfo-lyase n=1 Tax=Candidatus Moanibacter tarae TaxID=2200854 RepID=A0A2Z4AID9_9BACT|nr:MAG: L-cysteate sulfo-lyase [Candidatus Moanabacter tarae]|tara:strand:+ start:5128 stop:6123 length:996 start_codon:yes stop_codon:yes gene_type:complete